MMVMHTSPGLFPFGVPMTRTILALLLALGLVACACKMPVQVVANLAPAYLTAIQPGQYIDEGGQWLPNGCTAFSIDRASPVWMTAAHCIADPKGDGMYINA